MRRLLWRSAAAGIVILAAGSVMVTVGALVYDGWYRTQEPWNSIALSVVVAGLSISELAGTAWVLLAASPLLKLAVLVSAAIAALWWFAVIFVGFGPPGSSGGHDPRVVIHSLPELSAMAVGFPTLAIIAMAIGVRYLPAQDDVSDEPT